MSVLMTGKVLRVMTAGIPSPAMTVITAKNANVTIVRAAAHIARYATPRFAWDAAMNAPVVTNLFVSIAQMSVPSVMSNFVKIASTMKIYVITAKSRERNKKMKNSKKNQQQTPSLRFTPTSWAKLVFLRDMTENEVGGFGITEADDLLFVTDFVLVK